MNSPDPDKIVSTPPAEEPAPTVELVGFGPSLQLTEAPPPNPADAIALRRRLILRWVYALSFIALCAFAIFVGPGLYHKAKAWRAANLAREGEALLQKGRTDEAVATIRSSFLMAPNEPEVIRAMAQTFTKLKTPDAMLYWNWLLASNRATDDDRREAAEYALQESLFQSAATAIGTLLKNNPNDSRNLLLAARLSHSTGDAPSAMAYATRAALADPKDRSAAIFLALQEMQNPNLRQAGIDSLLRLADDDDIYGLLALQRVAGEPNLKSEEIDHIIARLHSHPLAMETQRLSAIALEFLRHPDQKKALLDQAVADREELPAQDLEEFSTWLISIGEPARILDAVTREKALTHKGLFKNYINALALLKRWTELQTLLLHEKVPLEAPYVQLYLSRCARELGDEHMADSYWNAAQAAAAHNPKENLSLATYAEQLGQLDRAEPIYLLLTQEPLVARVAFLGLLRINNDKETKAVRNILDQMASRWPADASIVNDDIYYNLLLNDHVDQMGQRAYALVKAEPDSLPHRTDLALAYLRIHKPEKALEVYRVSKTDWSKVTASSALVVYAATLDANGRNTEARHWARQLRRTTLRPEERALIKALR